MERKTVTLLEVCLLLVLATAATAAAAPGTPPDPPRKPFLYGRRFHLPKESTSGGDELYSPLITNPIRALPSNDSEAEELKQNQNEILSSAGEFMKKPAEKADVAGDNSNSSSRQDAERSLLVVLPFKPDGDNMEELYTKSPLVKVIETDRVNIKESDNLEEVTSRGPPVTREIVPTTEEEHITKEIVPATEEEHITREIVPTTEEQHVTRKRWRPLRYRTTAEVETTTDTTKVYTNYNDPDMVTKRFDTTGEPQNFTNHKYDVDIVTPSPVYIPEKKPETTTADLEEFLVVSTSEKATTEKPTRVKPKRKGQRRKPTTEGPPKPEELTKILDILPHDVKDLILQMGLNKDSKEGEAGGNNFKLERPAQPTIDPKSYAVFKPIPIEGRHENRNFVREEMKDFLASFGLLPVGGRVQKSMRSETTSNSSSRKPVEDLSDVNLDFLPDDLKSVLEDMGLTRSDSRKEPTRIHIFNPSNHSIAQSEEDFEKLNAILTSIKTTVNKSQSLTPEMQSEVIEKIRDLNNLRYKAGNLSEINNEIKKIVIDGGSRTETKHKSTSKRATKLNEGPDPVMLSEESLLKNDVKRQDNSTSTASASASASASGDATASASASASASAEGETATTTEEAPNIEALKESFGGGETAPDDADIDSSLPPKRPNGLYLLLDWNSFLEVGTEDDNRRVNLRFQPKIGDSRNFLPVSVP